MKDVPKYHEDVTVWEVLEKDGTHLGILYMDMYPRASKRGGAWMTSYREQSFENNKRKSPVISIVCNFSKPTANAPALLTFDEVSTYFHEFDTHYMDYCPMYIIRVWQEQMFPEILLNYLLRLWKTGPQNLKY